MQIKENTSIHPGKISLGVGRYAIDGSQDVLGWTAAVSFVGGEDTDLCPGVDKETNSRHWIGDVPEAARDDRASWICRSCRLVRPFPWWLQGGSTAACLITKTLVITTNRGVVGLACATVLSVTRGVQVTLL